MPDFVPLKDLKAGDAGEKILVFLNSFVEGYQQLSSAIKNSLQNAYKEFFIIYPIIILKAGRPDPFR